MGLGIIELLVLLLVLGGLAVALKSGAKALKWVFGGLGVLLVCGVGAMVVISWTEHRSAVAHQHAQARMEAATRALEMPREATPGEWHRQRAAELRRELEQARREAGHHDRHAPRMAPPIEYGPSAHVAHPAEARAFGGSHVVSRVSFLAILVAAVMFLCVVALSVLVFWMVRRKGSFGSVMGSVLLGTAVVVPALLALSFVGSVRTVERPATLTEHRADLDDPAERVEKRIQSPNAEAPEGTTSRASDIGFPFNMPSTHEAQSRDTTVVAPRPGTEQNALAREGEWLIREGQSKPLPDWVTETETSSDDSRRIVSGRQFASPQRALEDAKQRANMMVLSKFRRHRVSGELWGSFEWPKEAVDRAISRRHTQEITRSAGEHEFTVYRAYLQVDVSDHAMDQIEPIWRKQVTQKRSIQVGVIALVLTAIAGLLAGFFRLDDRTKGRYRWPLMGAAGVGIILLAAVPMVAGDWIVSFGL